MTLYYLAHIRLPTEKAHGLTIVKGCNAFAKAGARVVLVIPRRKTHIQTDIFETYGVPRTFEVRHVPTLDLLRFSSARWAFWGSYAVFYMAVFFLLLFASRRDAVIYTRDAGLLTLGWLGYKSFLECHHVFAKQRLYFGLARCARGIITISQALRDKFLVAGFAPERIIVEPSGVDMEVFGKETPREEARTELELPQSKPIILYTGNFTTMGEDKGISDILYALKELPDVLFVAAGGSEKDITRYTAQAQSLGVAGRTLLRGYAPQKTLALYSRAADILLMPFPDKPHYRSNMSPVKMFEYMAAGRPIIATKLPTIEEVLKSDMATLVPPDDPRALARAVQELLNNKEMAAQRATRARAEVERYSWVERATRVLTFLRGSFLVR